MGLTENLVRQALENLKYHYPEAGHDRKSLDIISHGYFEDLSTEIQTDNQFRAAVKQSRKDCNFFPKISDIIVAHRKCISSIKPERSVLQIQDVTTYHDPTEEEIETNKKRIGILKRVIAGDISFIEGEKLQEELLNK